MDHIFSLLALIMAVSMFLLALCVIGIIIEVLPERLLDLFLRITKF